MPGVGGEAAKVVKYHYDPENVRVKHSRYGLHLLLEVGDVLVILGVTMQQLSPSLTRYQAEQGWRLTAKAGRGDEEGNVLVWRYE